MRTTENVSKTKPAEAKTAAKEEKEEDPSAAKTTREEIKQRWKDFWSNDMFRLRLCSPSTLIGSLLGHSK